MLQDCQTCLTVFKLTTIKLSVQRFVPSPSARPAGTANASTGGIANASPSTSVQVCQASPPQTLHFTWSFCLLVEFHAFHIVC